MSRSASPGGTQVDPFVLLSYLRQSLDARDPLYDRLPAILDVFAIFHQLSNALIDAATSTIRAHKRLQNDLRAQGLGDESLTSHGGLTAEEGKRVSRIRHRWRGRDGQTGDDLMAIWSLQMRKAHIAVRLANPAVPFSDVAQLVELYFPADPTGRSRPLFCRVIQGEYLEDAAALRDIAQEPTIASLTRKPDGGMSVIARNMLLEAERVCSDLEAMQALFPGLALTNSNQASLSQHRTHDPPVTAPSPVTGPGGQETQDVGLDGPMPATDPTSSSGTPLPTAKKRAHRSALDRRRSMEVR